MSPRGHCESELRPPCLEAVVSPKVQAFGRIISAVEDSYAVVVLSSIVPRCFSSRSDALLFRPENLPGTSVDLVRCAFRSIYPSPAAPTDNSAGVQACCTARTLVGDYAILYLGNGHEHSDDTDDPGYRPIFRGNSAGWSNSATDHGRWDNRKYQFRRALGYSHALAAGWGPRSLRLEELEVAESRVISPYKKPCVCRTVRRG